ncbi:oligosaccharide flippase family protein [Ruminococcus sp.]|uniref:oligosaccharide flippase family protein n=1 Tax=Ruminococcus sp. TaxID=41978 RepID=UPI0025E9479C|nr:oligosaccharide flippase family protein [Ruminococcus sp.]MBR1431510.1 oligosaccharide flippase family protein [Ruminococcus sp.]
MNQKRVGIIISYLNLILGMVVNVFLTPMLISALGDTDYSLYKVVQSFSGPLSIFNLGISTIVTRSIVQCSDESRKKEKQNTMALALLASGAMALLVTAIGIGMYIMFPQIYGGNYTAEEVAVGQWIFIAFMCSSILHIMTDVFTGTIIGHEKFAVSSAIQFGKTALKIVLWLALLIMKGGALQFACIDAIISLSTFVISLWYASFRLGEKPKLTYFDKRKLADIFLFGIAILLQAVVNQVNNNVDTMILGAVIVEKSIITMYSSALAIYSIYNSLIAVIAGFFLPKATKLFDQNASGTEITDFVIGPGRFQAMIAIGSIAGFALFGRNFITIWIGEKYIDAYWVTLMLMIPVTIPLVENTMISVLDASLKRIYRSVTLVVISVINIAVSLVLVQYLSFWGAAIGTVVSLLIGHGVLMNIYYAKTFKLQVFRMFRSIFKGILPAGIAASAVCIPIAVFVPDTILLFIVKCAVFIALYGAFLMLFGINEREKGIILKTLRLRK